MRRQATPRTTLRLAVTVLGCLLAAPAWAQTPDTPPVVGTAPPALALTPETALTPPPLSGVPVTGAVAHGSKAADLAPLVLEAHPVVQAVMALLAAAVFAVLTVFLYKLVEYRIAFSRLARSARALGQDKAASGLPSCPLMASNQAARQEIADLPARLTSDLRASARERLDLSLARIEAAAVQRLRSGTGLLASIGAVGPFVGLFGTVFGIMNSFMAIAETKTTNLSVVAPGIAEALLATGLGLVAAIPAVLLYNHLTRRIAAYRHRLADGTAEVLRSFSRALDARMAAGG
ncbi:MotA/TolQ/ExbB proton channel family protein [Pseudogemmobacter blasticus]|uniref:TonB-system energizer ExbB n=1 Tax=Fuscovulum blasticum DSM 2131 TaxID=1188250 RepID=A0A2T4JF49_FUSBL|nr:MotA/TolQ/ExbB proton channel family protein [Fuscovulum blasticum]PTE16544.1 tonB-system energizer ExbB [Fuscovulum blasticum DSM 2131]